MDERHRSLLRRHTVIFQKDLEPIKLLPYLVSVLDTYDEQEIRNQGIREDQVHKLLDILPRKGPLAFPCFLDGLEEVQPHLAVSLREEEEMEKQLLEVKSELGRVRSHSAKLRNELRTLNVSLESEKNKKDNMRKELEELKSLHKSLLRQSREEKEKLMFNVNELNNVKDALERELTSEKSLRSELQRKCCQLEEESNERSREIQDLQHHIGRRSKSLDNHGRRSPFPPVMKKQSFDMTNNTSRPESLRKRTYSERDAPTRDEDSIDDTHSRLDESIQQKYCELERKLHLITTERDNSMTLCKELADKLKICEENKPLYVDRASTPMVDPENFNCNKCALMESNCEQVKQEMEAQVSNLTENSRKLECKLKELSEEFEREKQSLETKFYRMEELYNTCKIEHANELKNTKNDLSEQYYNEIKSVKDELTSQIDREKLTISRIRCELDRERDTNRSTQKDHEKFKKKSNSEKKQLKQKHEQEMKSKVAMLKEMECELQETKESKERSLEETTRLKAAIREKNDIQEQLLEEIERWRTLPGRAFNYRKDFDRNGIIYNLGPKRIQVTRSSNDQGKPEDILDTRKGTLSCTGDFEHSWWLVDFGEDHTLFATHYTLRHGRDNGMSIIRNWNLEGSRNGRDWKVLKKHENDRGMRGVFPFYTGTWAIEGNIEAMRYFRIYQTGKNSSGRHALCLSGFEIYGVLLDMR